MEARKLLPLLAALVMVASGSLIYVSLAQGSATASGIAEQDVLVESIRVPGAIVMGIHRGDGPSVLYVLVDQGDEYTTVLAYSFRFLGIAEIHNRSLVAKAGALNTSWACSDFKIIRHRGRPIGLLMAFRSQGPIYVSYEEPYADSSGYYEVNMTVVLAAIYHPRLGESILARFGGGNGSLVSYDVVGGLVLIAGFKVEGWPDAGPGEGHLLMAFSIRLRARCWEKDGSEGEAGRVIWVSPFCGYTRPRLVGRRALVRGVFAFSGRAAVSSGEGWEGVRAYCVYVVKGFRLYLAIAVPKAGAVRYPAPRA
ncbi:hypothetical protein DRO32_03395 [Candidatus Bathyarchaeota archaeon]|nr:MAG: hypothetical protein DRO32_03395 [Candidatus Bathyarchaeota archaeon]